MKVLMSAYACEPGRGSEPGAGWAWACAAARDHEVWVLTHETNRASITAALTADPDLGSRLHPVFLRNARWFRPLRRKGATRYLYYWIWQLGPCRRSARELETKIGFDVSHHLTYASDWMPAGVSSVDVPFVWGPVGGSSTRRSPQLWRRLGWRTLAMESLRALILDRIRSVVGRRLADRASVVLGQNHDVVRAFAPIPVVVEPNVALEPADLPTTRSRVAGQPPQAVFAGNLIGLKGLRIAIAVLAHPAAALWRLDVYGDGPIRDSLLRQASRLGVSDRVRFLGARPRPEVRSALVRADVLLFPSIRDAAGWSVAEALAGGCPVLCFDLGGPAALVGAADGVLVDPHADVVAAFAEGLDRARTLVPRHDRWSTTRLPGVLSDAYETATARAAADGSAG